MPEQAPTLRDMIQKAMDAGDSLRDLEKRANDGHGNKAGKDIIRNIANGLQNRIPLESSLRGIAAALRVPYEQVRQAAIREWLPPEDGAVDEMPADSRAELIAEYERLRAAILEEARGTSADTAEAGGAA